MKMMGLANWVHWCAWLTKHLLFLLISGVVIVIVLKVRLAVTCKSVGIVDCIKFVQGI